MTAAEARAAAQAEGLLLLRSRYARTGGSGYRNVYMKRTGQGAPRFMAVDETEHLLGTCDCAEAAASS